MTLHAAKVPFGLVIMPILRHVQAALWNYGHALFDTAAKLDIVKQILNKPYAQQSAVDDTLIQLLLDPILLPGASQVVFETLSYSAGPLPEQQLSSPKFPVDKPVWVVYGEAPSAVGHGYNLSFV